jgi:hypothetical protein
MDIRRLNPPQVPVGRDSAESMLYEMIIAIQLSANPFAKKDVEDQGSIAPQSIATVRQKLQALNVDYQMCDVDVTEIAFNDVSNVGRALYFFGIELHSRHFDAGYVVARGVILAKFENQ